MGRFISVFGDVVAVAILFLIAAVRAAFGALSDAQRLAFVTETVRDIRDIHCRLQLGRLIRAAEATATELSREAMLRGKL